MPNIGPLEIAIVLAIVLIIFGPKRLPGLGKQLGTGMREFKESITGSDKRRDHDDDDDDRHQVEASLGPPRWRRVAAEGRHRSRAHPALIVRPRRL